MAPLNPSLLCRIVAWMLLLVVSGGGVAHAQDAVPKTLRGRVVDAETGRPLAEANLRVADTYEGTITNVEGH